MEVAYDQHVQEIVLQPIVFETIRASQFSNKVSYKFIRDLAGSTDFFRATFINPFQLLINTSKCIKQKKETSLGLFDYIGLVYSNKRAFIQLHTSVDNIDALSIQQHTEKKKNRIAEDTATSLTQQKLKLCEI